MSKWWFKALRSFGTGVSLLLFAGGWVFYYVTIAIWSEEALSRFVTTLLNNGIVQLITLLFLLDLLVYVVRTAMKIAAANKWMLLLWLPLYLGLLLFFTGFFINSVMLKDGVIIVGEGDTIAPPWGEASVLVEQIDPGLKDELLGVDSPESTIFQYEPTVVLRDSLNEYTVRGFAPTKIGSTYYHVLDFGLAPGIRLTGENRVLIESHVIQRLLPPGKIDSFLLGNLPYRVEIRIASSRTVKKGTTEAPVYNLANLRFNTLVYRGENQIYEGLSGEGIPFDGMNLEFAPHIYWVRVEAARRPGMIPLVLGLPLILIGFPFWSGLKIVHLIQRRRIELE
jgi:hypothetical protein